MTSERGGDIEWGLTETEKPGRSRGRTYTFHKRLLSAPEGAKAIVKLRLTTPPGVESVRQERGVHGTPYKSLPSFSVPSVADKFFRVFR